MAIKAIGYGQQQPYVGPRAFSKEDAPLFFGRDREAAELLSLILAHPVVLLYAPSGAGKTSLLQAKIITLLKERDDLVLGSVRVGGETSTASEIRNVFVFNALTSLQGEIRATTELVDQTLQEYLEGQSAPDTAEDFSQRRVIIFDQFEEIFTSYPERWLDRKGFFDEINEALADPLLRIVFAMREEYIASLDPYADRLPGRLSTRLRLEPLRKKAALLAVAGPLAGTGRSFTLAASEKLVDNLLHVSVKSEDGMSVASGEFVEPLQLQIVCQRLWRSLPKELETIDEDYIRDYGDVDEALANYYEGCIGEVVQTSGADESLLRSWFDSALITPGGTRGLVYRDRKTTRKLPNEWVDLLEKLYLVRAEMRGGARWYELIHDRFINPIRSSNSIWKKQRLRKSLSDQEVEEYVRFKAFKNGEARRLSAKLGRPERLWHKLLEEPGASEEGVLQDWQSAELIFALDVLEGGVHLSGRIGRRSLRQLEKEWFAEAKRTKAYLLWEEGDSSSDASRHESDYYRACESFRKRLVDPEVKSHVEDFSSIEGYLRERYLDSRGKFDERKKHAKDLLDLKAYRISEHSLEKNEDLDWSHALGYAKMFYDNVLPAVKERDEESTLFALKAFQYSKAPENRYLIINCLETAIAIYFFDAAMIRKFWEESSERPGPEPYTQSTVTLAEWSGSWSPPLRLADRLSFHKGTLVVRGMLRQSERDELLADAPAEFASEIEELYRHSRLLPEETTL